jgi:S1-C subfamily serine protease
VLRAALLLGAAAGGLPAGRGHAQAGAAPPGAGDAGHERLREALGSVVRIRMRAVHDATSQELLGLEREGSGVLIDSSGLILTIAYIVMEAERIEVSGSDGRVTPAALVAFDQPTGLALLRTALPLKMRPIELGDSRALEPYQPVLIASAIGADIAHVASRRRFTGYWEYILDNAIFTAPPRGDFAGAALIGRDGRLLGIGSLFVPDALTPKLSMPGNLFVPVEALQPVLGDLIANGRRGSSRPWIGIHTQEIQGRVVVMRTTPESPAAKAGLRKGDIITGIGGTEIQGQTDLYQRMWALGKAGAIVPLQVLQGNRVETIRVPSMDRFEHFRSPPAL